jgi:hypothetical protein
MQNIKRQGVFDFLTGRRATLRALQLDLSRQLMEGHPSVAGHPEFIRQVVRIQEHLPSCEWLLATLPQLSAAESDWGPAIRVEMAKLNERIGVHLAVIRTNPNTLRANLANESVTALLGLHADLDVFVEEQANWFVTPAKLAQAGANASPVTSS